MSAAHGVPSSCADVFQPASVALTGPVLTCSGPVYSSSREVVSDALPLSEQPARPCGHLQVVAIKPQLHMLYHTNAGTCMHTSLLFCSCCLKIYSDVKTSLNVMCYVLIV